MRRPAPILCLSRSSWSDERRRPRNRFQILSRFAKGRRVLMLEHPFDLIRLGRPSGAKLRELAQTLGPVRRWPDGVETLRPLGWWLRDGEALAWRLNLALYRPWLRRALGRLGRPPIVWVYDHRLWPLLDELPSVAAVYHCTDDYPGMAERAQGRRVGAWVAEQERRLLERVNLVFAVSEGLAAERGRLHAAVHVARNGVDLDRLRPDAPCVPACAGLRRLPVPRLGYVGAANYRLDYGLLERVAERFPDGSLVLIGDAEPSEGLERLRARPNVHLLGHRPPGELAALIAHLDVCLIPFVDDAWFVRAAQPLKVFEYLACGKPVVSTGLPNLAPWRDVVALTRTPDEFVEACGAALRGDAPERRARRLAAARENSWEARFAEIEARLAELERGRG